MAATRLPCPHDGCPGLEMHEGKPDGCGHPDITSGCRAVVAERDGLRLACQALAAVVREDYGEEMELADILRTWTPLGVSEEQIEALGALQARIEARP